MFGFREDVKRVFLQDPAAHSRLAVVLTYPGLHAVWAYRISHWLYQHRLRTVAKILAYLTRMITGIEIHPGATIGRRLFIDHGHGVVIGETAIVGDDVTMFHGVTLGGTGKDKGKRHPIIGNRVFLSAGAKILGPITIGDESKIGAGAVVLHDIPPRCTVVGVPGRIVKRDGQTVRRRVD